jgi:hypothetical protein
MPRISEFYGIAIDMYYDDHGVPHFHAYYAEANASISIEGLAVLEGSLPGRILRLCRQWASMHKEELREDWRRAKERQPLLKIDPLN